MKQKIGRCERLIRFIGREVGGPVLPPTRKRNDQAYNQNSRGGLGRGWPGGSPWILGTGFWGVAIRESLEYNGESSAPLSTFWGGFVVHREGSVPQSQCGCQERACHRHSGCMGVVGNSLVELDAVARALEVALRHGLPGKASHPGTLVDPRDGWLQRNPFSWVNLYFPNAAMVDRGIKAIG